MIELKNVTKFYPVNGKKNYILKNVSLTIPPGINIGILGRNGAGKSTLLRMLGGIDFPNSGTIKSPYTFSWPIGLTGGFQGSLTGRENASFVCQVYSKTPKKKKETLEFIKEFSELGNYFDMPVKTYSSGMRARLGFSLSMAFDFDYYLIDEVLSVGDKIFRKKAKHSIQKKLSGKNFIIISHNTKTITDNCNAIITLHNGLLRFFSNTKEGIIFYKNSLKY